VITIFEALAKASEELKNAQKMKRQALQNPKLDSQVLLSHCIQKPTSYLFAHGDEPLSEEVQRQFAALIARRANHEPVAYILGEKEFFKRPFRVSPATLIPRPETEMLIELTIKESKPGTVFADIGTGSGAIAITLAAETGGFVFATDISADAIAVAKENAKTLGVAERVFFLEGDLILPFVNDLKTWLERAELKRITLVANLPYIPRRHYENLDPDVKDFEPKTALLGGIDGLEIYDHLLRQLVTYRSYFPPELRILFEIDPSQDMSGPSLIRHHFPYASVAVIEDLSHKARILDAAI
jgi:release factor glutamine methyltransferase